MRQNFNIETPNNGIANKAAGTKPIRVLKIAVNVSAAIISFSLIGDEQILLKFSPNFFKKHHIMLIRSKKKSYNMAALRIIPTMFLKRRI